MSEILTESFCERCGTRYTFESPARRTTPLGALGTVGRGLRNFVNQPDQSIDEAFAVARAETEQRATAHQLEAFHRTFNFCLSCRQYTCGECWNPVEGRCQSCAPMPELETATVEASLAAPETLTDAESVEDAPVVYEAIAIARAAAAPVLESPEDLVAEPDVEVEPEPEALIELEAAPEGEAEPAVNLEPKPEALVEPLDEIADEPEPVAATEPFLESPAPSEPAAAGPLSIFPPGVSLDEEIAAYDLRMAALAVPPPMAPPVPPTYMPPAPPAVQPIAATATPISQPIAQAPMSAPAPRIVAAIVPDLPAASAAAMPAAQAAASCPSCGLALSATARFCRRCGMAQQH